MLVMKNLEAITRAYMFQEVRRDIDKNILYFSPRLNDFGRLHWAAAMTEAVQHGSDMTLEKLLIEKSFLKEFEERKKPKGGVIMARVPVTAAQTLAEGEFNRFYIRGLCLRAIADGIPHLQIYRGKDVVSPRQESLQKIGTFIEPQQILTDLRSNMGVDTALGMPPGPNSGLSLKIPTRDLS